MAGLRVGVNFVKLSKYLQTRQHSNDLGRDTGDLRGTHRQNVRGQAGTGGVLAKGGEWHLRVHGSREACLSRHSRFTLDKIRPESLRQLGDDSAQELPGRASESLRNGCYTFATRR